MRIELRQALIVYQDHHMLLLIVLRQALISYQDYHMLLLTLAGGACAGDAGTQRGGRPSEHRGDGAARVPAAPFDAYDEAELVRCAGGLPFFSFFFFPPHTKKKK